MTRLSIAMFVPGMKFHGKSLTEHSLGGSETAGLSVAKALAQIGHDVRVFANTPEMHFDDVGVQYIPIEMFQKFAPLIPHDVCIAQRAPSVFGNRMESKINVLWAHDLAMGRQTQEVRSAMWNIDRIFTVSKYHAEQYQKVYDLPAEVMYPTRNGIHLAMQPEPAERNPKRVIYTARPERGLDVLIDKIMPLIWEQDPEVELQIAAYDNTVDEMREFYAYVHQLVAKNGDRVKLLGSLTKPQLYDLYNTSALYLYPTPSPTSPNFREVSCITAMECMMCGLPVISSDKGALKETLHPGAGQLLEGDSSSETYQARFAQTTISLLQDSEMREAMSILGRKRAQFLDWQGVADDWSEKFIQWIEERSKNKKSLALHLMRQSDIMVAEQVAKDTNDQAILAEIDEHYGWVKGRKTHADHYEKIGQTHTDVYEQMGREPRFKTLVAKLNERGVTSGRILDFGCAHGSYSVHLSNAFPEMKVHGVDIDKYGIEWAEKHKAAHSEHPDNVDFVTIEGPDDIPHIWGEPFDAIFIGEVLEHVPEPWTLLDKLEALVKPGGLVIATTPYGPWEEDSYKTYPHRCHVWELDFFALREMLGGDKGQQNGKKELQIEQVHLARSQIQGRALGICFTTYRNDPERKTKTVNFYRKNNIQAVRQSVSVSMICGDGAEETLPWCLNSVKDVADEIIIGDTGMNDYGKAIAERYGAKLVPAPDPKVEGFDEARNATLPACTMDWILWIDSDEKLINPDVLGKYLRPNMFAAYGVKQHHFSVDAAFNPDLPCRLFRNGLGLKFFGSCHEHPETELNKGPGMSIVLADVSIAHIGYLNESVRRIRFGRNSPLMEMSLKKFPDRLLNKYFVMRDEMLRVNYALQQTQGRVTPECTQKSQKVVDLYREFFCGKPVFMAAEAVKFYSDACRVLGIGAEVRISLNAIKAGEPGNGSAVFRYGSAEDLTKDLTARAEQAMKPLCDPNF